MPTITEIPEEHVNLEKGYNHGVYVILHFNKENGVDIKEDRADVKQGPDEEDTEDVK